MNLISHGENTHVVRAVSTIFSRPEKDISVYLEAVDDLAERLLQRINALLKERADLNQVAFGRHIGRGRSWVSEFFNKTRTTNDLRLVVAMARVLRVPPGYLLNVETAPQDAKTTTLLGAWQTLTDERDRDAVMNLALQLRREPDSPTPRQPQGETGAAETHIERPTLKQPTRKHRR